MRVLPGRARGAGTIRRQVHPQSLAGPARRAARGGPAQSGPRCLVRHSRRTELGFKSGVGRQNCQFSHNQRLGFVRVKHGKTIGLGWIKIERHPLCRFRYGKISCHDKSQRDVCAGREKILVVRHGRRNEIVPVQNLAFGFQFAFAIFPGAFAAPVFLGVKNRNQRGENGEAQSKNAVFPAKKTTEAKNSTRTNHKWTCAGTMRE